MHFQRDEAGKAPETLLKTFLKGKRDRLQPEQVGLPNRRQKRSAGLTRDDMAELVGVTPLWYSLFESGTSRRRFSADFLRRVRDALQLDATDYDTLLWLAVASKNATVELEVQWYSVKWGRLIDFVSDVADQIATAAPEDATQLAKASLRSMLEQLVPTLEYP